MGTALEGASEDRGERIRASGALQRQARVLVAHYTSATTPVAFAATRDSDSHENLVLGSTSFKASAIANIALATQPEIMVATTGSLVS